MGEISFSVNDHDLGVAYKDVHQDKIYPAVDIWVSSF